MPVFWTGCGSGSIGYPVELSGTNFSLYITGLVCWGKSENRKPMGFFTIKYRYRAFRLKFSHHPVLWCKSGNMDSKPAEKGLFCVIYVRLAMGRRWRSLLFFFCIEPLMPSQVANFFMCHPLRFWAPLRSNKQKEANGWQAWLSHTHTYMYVYIYISRIIHHSFNWMIFGMANGVYKSRPTSTMVISCRERSCQFPEVPQHVWKRT